MIQPADVLEYLKRRPFEPFRILMSDGTTYDVQHPDLCILSRNTLYIGIPNPKLPGAAMGVHHCALVHVVRFETVNGHRPRRKKA